jgi:hypothetical protein
MSYVIMAMVSFLGVEKSAYVLTLDFVRVWSKMPSLASLSRDCQPNDVSIALVGFVTIVQDLVRIWLPLETPQSEYFPGRLVDGAILLHRDLIARTENRL